MQRENRTESAENYHTVEWSQQEASQEGSTKEAQDISSASKIKDSTAMGLKTTALQGGKVKTSGPRKLQFPQDLALGHYWL